MNAAARPPLVVLQGDADRIGRSTLGRLALAARFSGAIEVVVGARPTPDALAALGEHGVGVVHLVGESGGAEGGWEELADSLATLAMARAAEVVVIGSGPAGRDIAGRLSALLDTAAVADVTAAQPGDEVRAISSGPGGTVDVTTTCGPGRPVILLVRGGAPAAVEERAGPKKVPAGDDGGGAPSGGAPPDVLPAPAVGEKRRRARLVRRDPAPAAGGPALEEARVVFCAGGGLRDAATAARLAEAAAMVGAAVGATRAAVDAGWAHPRQLIGQSGLSVAPEVCVCWGVSGAPQHLMGLRGAQHLVAVNRDPDAPIFRQAEVGIVGDARTVLDQLLAELRFRATWQVGDTGPGRAAERE